MNHKHMNITSRKSGTGSTLRNRPAFGSVCARMHQKNENVYRRSRLTDEAAAESMKKALDIPVDLEAMIPPEAEATVQQAEISADEEVFTLIESDETESAAEDAPEEMTLSVDYSAERIPELKPVTGGVSCEPYALVYDRGDGEPRVIPDPLGILTEEGLYPFFPEVENPSANVAEIRS